MRNLIVFNNVSLDGFFSAADGDVRWAQSAMDDTEFNAFVAQNAGGGGQLLLGRLTYEMMAAYWPTPLARQNNPQVAEGMNQMPKVVFSRTLDQALWSNTTLVKDDLPAAVRKLKEQEGPGLVILGSGSIVAQLTAEGLIDEYHLVINPVLLGKGRTMFEGLNSSVNLRLLNARTFSKSGKMFVRYAPSA